MEIKPLISISAQMEYHTKEIQKLKKEKQKQTDTEKFKKAKQQLEKCIAEIDKILNNEKEETYDNFIDCFEDQLNLPLASFAVARYPPF